METAGAPGRRVSIFVAAGESTTFGTLEQRGSCATTEDCNGGSTCIDDQCTMAPDAWQTASNSDRATTCDLYTLDVNLDAAVVESARLVVDPDVAIEPGSSLLAPAASPNVRFVAFEYRDAAEAGEIAVCALHSGECALLTTDRDARHPAWLTDQQLLFSVSVDTYPGWADTWILPLDTTGALPSPASDPRILLGEVGTPAGVDTSGFAFSDPRRRATTARA